MIRWVVSLLAVMGMAFVVAPNVATQDEVSYTDAGAYASGWREINVTRQDGSFLMLGCSFLQHAPAPMQPSLLPAHLTQ